MFLVCICSLCQPVTCSWYRQINTATGCGQNNNYVELYTYMLYHPYEVYMFCSPLDAMSIYVLYTECIMARWGLDLSLPGIRELAKSLLCGLQSCDDISNIKEKYTLADLPTLTVSPWDSRFHVSPHGLTVYAINLTVSRAYLDVLLHG